MASAPGSQLSSGTPDWMINRGSSGAYGSIPQLPPYTKDINTTVGTDVQANLLKNLPGYQQMLATDTGNIQNNLSGQVAPDVIAQLQQQGAERGISTGSPGSPNANSAYLRALGLTSMQLQQLGNTQLTAAMGRTPVQQTQTGTQQTDLAAQQAVYNSAPNPAAAAAAAMGAARSGMGAGFGGGAAPITQPSTSASSALGAMGYNLLPSYGGTGLGEPTPWWNPQPSETTYNPTTDQSQYNYGVPNYYDTQGDFGDEYAGTPMEGDISDPYSDWWTGGG